MDNYVPIRLPSKCLPYEGVNPDDVKIRAYQGRDEIFLAEITPINIEQKFLQVLNNVLRGIDPQKLTLGDRLYIIVWECINSYTEIVRVKDICSYCFKEAEFSVDLRELEVIELPDNYKQPYEVKLPSGKVVHLRLLTVKDEIEAQNFERGNDSSFLYKLARSIVDDRNVLERMRDLENMSAKDITVIRAFHEKFYHGPEMKAKVKCPNCGEEDEISVPFRLDFIFPDGETLGATFGEGI